MAESKPTPAHQKKRMSRPERRAQLLRVARDIIVSEGVEALTMSALAECANVTKPVVYSHFSNSEQVILAMFDDHYESMRIYVREGTSGATTAEEYISALIDSSFDFERSNLLPIQKLSNGYSSRPAVNAAFIRYRNLFQAFWQQVLEQQGVPKAVAEITALGFSSLVNETTMAYATRPRSQNLARDTLKRILISTIGTLSIRRTNLPPDVHVETYLANGAAA